MTYDEFITEFLARGLIKKQKPDFKAAEKLILRARKDIKVAEATIDIDEGIAYSVAYLAMLRAGMALMLLRGYRSADGYQHKTVVEFMVHCLGKEFAATVERFDNMRRKRNVFTYDVDVTISKTEVNNALKTSTAFVALIEKVIKDENPQIRFKF